MVDVVPHEWQRIDQACLDIDERGRMLWHRVGEIAENTGFECGLVRHDHFNVATRLHDAGRNLGPGITGTVSEPRMMGDGAGSADDVTAELSGYVSPVASWAFGPWRSSCPPVPRHGETQEEASLHIRGVVFTPADGFDADFFIAHHLLGARGGRLLPFR